MEKLLATGKVKAIGVCNYSVKYLQELLAVATVVPAVNQIENHPQLPQQEVVDFCKEKGIHVTAYSPLGSTGSPLFTAPAVVEIAKKKNVTPASVLLSYHSKFPLITHLSLPLCLVRPILILETVARGSSVLAKSVNPDRIEANKNIIKLDEEDMKHLTQYSEELKKEGQQKRYVYPAFGVNFGFPDQNTGRIA